MAKKAANAHEAPYGKRLLRDVRKNYPLYLLALPAVIVIFLLNYMPMYGIVMAFQDFRPVRGFFGSRWVGFANFERFFNSYQFVDLLKNTLGLSLMNLLFTFPVPIFLAIMINQVYKPRLKKTIQTVVYLPHFIATVVLVSMLHVLFNTRTGLYGVIAGKLGIENPVNLFALKSSFRPMFIGASIWQNAGWDSIIYIAALAGIDQSQHEAAMIDGCTPAQAMWNVTIPLMRASFVQCIFLSITRCFVIYDVNLSLTKVKFLFGLSQEM